ncbi:Ppx/GppA phosphatase family protein [Kiloniella laminariae]|uniref:Ppx/GppA phosphatase family protein n=1 Tax=Kiloniella laminariae TaxID=454162 RepID=UPI000380ECEF|nr:Ppx/GppA phosphatase family protein [Kiloniella laminariae]
MTVTTQSRKRSLSGRGSRRADDHIYAAIDLGTNNCRLLVARRNRKSFRVLDTFSRIVRLGEGLGQSGLLSDAAMNRTISALSICATKLQRRGVTRLRCVATEACRRATNRNIFVERVAAETGLQLEIIDHSEEANLGILGCAPLLNPEIPEALIFDIGGGSTEVSWIRLPEASAGSNGPEPVMQDWFSVPKGVVSLAEKYGGRDIPQNVYRQMVGEIQDDFLAFEEKHGFAGRIAEGKLQMLGTSGTVTTLVGVYKKLPRYDRNRVDGTLMNRTTAVGLCHKIAAMSYDQRVANPCIGDQRADLVVAGCAIFEALARLWPVPQLRVADRGLREGILYKLMNGG